MDRGKVAEECETCSPHAICSLDTAFLFPCVLTDLFKTELRIAARWKCPYTHIGSARTHVEKKKKHHCCGVLLKDGVYVFLFLLLHLQPRRSPTCSASAGDQELPLRASSCWSWSTSSSWTSTCHDPSASRWRRHSCWQKLRYPRIRLICIFYMHYIYILE